VRTPRNRRAIHEDGIARDRLAVIGGRRGLTSVGISQEGVGVPTGP
jgi:hypothetical protein